MINELESMMNANEGMGVNINRVNVSALMYADDLVLVSQTEDGLQRGINALYSFCTENKNKNKKRIRILLFRNRYLAQSLKHV